MKLDWSRWKREKAVDEKRSCETTKNCNNLFWDVYLPEFRAKPEPNHHTAGKQWNWFLFPFQPAIERTLWISVINWRELHVHNPFDTHSVEISVYLRWAWDEINSNSGGVWRGTFIYYWTWVRSLGRRAIMIQLKSMPFNRHLRERNSFIPVLLIFLLLRELWDLIREESIESRTWLLNLFLAWETTYLHSLLFRCVQVTYRNKSHADTQ